MITLASFHPEHFNNNADQGNLLVLKRQLLWRGIECSEPEHFDVDADFVLIGDASRAAIRFHEAELHALVPALERRAADGLPTLLVGSAAQWFAENGIGLSPAKTDRKSEFREVQTGTIKAFGYRNTELTQDLFVNGGFIATTLYGPVLAKSPELLSHLVSYMGIDSDLPAEVGNRLDNLVEKAIAANAD